MNKKSSEDAIKGFTLLKQLKNMKFCQSQRKEKIICGAPVKTHSAEGVHEFSGQKIATHLDQSDMDISHAAPSWAVAAQKLYSLGPWKMDQ